MLRSELYQLAFDAIKDPILVADAQGGVLLLNQAAASAFELGPSQNLTDARIYDEAFDFDAEEVLSLLKRRGHFYDQRVRDAEGNEGNVAIDVVDLGTSDPALKLVCFRDLSALGKNERWRDELISMLSHEIRNPLSAIRNSVNILLGQIPDPLTEGQERFLKTSMRSIDRLTRLLDGVLDVSRIYSGAFELKPAWVDLTRFIPDVIGSFETLFNVRRATLKWDIEEKLNRVFADAEKLEQVLLNLLSNALKYTPEGGEIEIAVREAGIESLDDDMRLLPWKELPSPQLIRITVRDTGLGMNEETLANLFTRYYKASKKSRVGGTHLGLSISKTLVEAQNGLLDVKSKLGIGTEVNVLLPRDERTGYILQSLNSVRANLRRSLSENKHVGFCTVGKESAECWLDLTKAWRKQPMVNPSVGEGLREKFLLWTLSEYLAVAMVLDPDQQGSLENSFGGQGRPGEDARRFDGFAVGLSHAPEEGESLARLFNISLKRMAQASRLGQPFGLRG
jgi:signal transduction histidine kinase